MLLDYPSLLVSIGFSAICLSIVLFTAWMTSRADGFLLTSALGTAFVVGNAFTYSLYLASPSPFLSAFAFSFLLAGLSVLYGASVQFRLRISPWPRAGLAALLSLGIALPPFAYGYDGIGFGLINLAAATLLVFIIHQYWQARAEAPTTIAGMCALYLLVAVSFALCALMFVLDGKTVLAGPPDNWAEDFNLIAVIAGVPGLGALTLALNQARLGAAHKRAAMTDSLTGLLNRRALFEAYGGELRVPVAVVLFDIDRFKTINDEHGHAAGDRVIALFAEALRDTVAKEYVAARLGGEEFALVLPRSSAEVTLRHAERVRSIFTTLALQEGFVCSASAGIAFGAAQTSFEAALSAADQALYQAKHDGRDRIASAGLRVVGEPGTWPPRPSSRV